MQKATMNNNPILAILYICDVSLFLSNEKLSLTVRTGEMLLRICDVYDLTIVQRLICSVLRSAAI